MKTLVPLLAASLLAVSLGLAACNAPAPQTSARRRPVRLRSRHPDSSCLKARTVQLKSPVIARSRTTICPWAMSCSRSTIRLSARRTPPRRCAQPAATLTPSRWSLLHKGATVIRPVFERKRSADNRRQSSAPALHRCLPDRAQCACARTRPRGRAPGTPRSAP